MADKSLNTPALSSILDISKRTIESYLAGRAPGPEFLAAITTRLGVSASWLLTGEGMPYGESRTNVVGATAVVAMPDFLSLPRYTVEASAGHGSFVGAETADDFIAVSKDWLTNRGLKGDSLALISVKGDSMAPALIDGELIMLDTSQTTLRHGAIFVVSYSDGLFVKRIQQLPGDRLQLISSNPEYPPIIVDHADTGQVKVIGRIVASIREW